MLADECPRSYKGVDFAVTWDIILSLSDGLSGATKTFRRVVMNKAELIERVSKDTNLTKTDVENALNSITRWIKDCVKKNDEVKLIGFGTFTKTKRKARTGRNPQTGAEIKIPATNVPRFKPGKEFKDLVN